ncbi:MAG: class I mannose-6-phosphate isomerase [Planctomycetes bacterium]|nr:class I mannose-6-phosphate isomerase [Planctomycetota bacterium]
MPLRPHPTLLIPEPGPTTLKSRPWGGRRLAAMHDGPIAVPLPIGESWEFSTMPDSESRTNGLPLSQVLGRPLPFLGKLLDTASELSIQVHPGDDATTGRGGKEEAWVVLAADPEARVLAGIRPGIDAATFAVATRGAAEDPGRGAELLDALRPIPVRPGTVILVPAGTVHAVGAGILLAELQQPSDCTLRLFDHGSERELHVGAALAALRVDSSPTVWQPGAPPTTLRGKHLVLEVLGRGRHQRLAKDDELLITIADTNRVVLDDAEITVPAGAMRLATPGLRYAIEVAADGDAVIGRIDATAG